MFIFLLGAMQIFLWMNRNIIDRQKAYQESRLSLGDFTRKPGKNDEIKSIDFYQPTEFSVFSQEGE
ncbi:MAG: hypothetical protein JSV30_06205 [Candidatus Omnitrophota bacterium]|nr:MAG: hypothetical protein JSV30_06205 [Candidatus Omnitrophota bacterium]